MSAAENTPPKASAPDQSQPLNGPPKRPSLRKPPPRPAATPPSAHQPASPAPALETPAASTVVTAEPAPSVPETKSSLHPIAPPSEPMQYRAIGLVRGVYQPSEEQLNRGNIVADDGTTQIDSVLLGRVTSLIKKHIDLEKPHLWVVYPRTRQATEYDADAEEESSLHLQIVGVWEPDTLGLPGENPKTEDGSDDAEADAATDEPETAVADSDAAATLPSENYFSVRGEVLAYDEDTETILVKIVQGSKRSGKGPKAFKVHVFGAIAGKTVGYFWEFEVERQGEKLVMTDGRPIRMVPPKKKKQGGRGGGFPRRNRRGDGGDRPSRPTRNADKPRVKPPAPVKSNPL
ncbi:hypothetical protein [Leptolyngbya iicbica]|uniref:Uncharacterized protein n=2 Tax=Cyanophyceae TaxID=3028117 RepID=A0A4Q7E2Z2_9CYAN|nr:hypothetical protein [Leptolyngbya sp. LK]RZM75661.1 hypothetical protein DYY88_20385 [Leptolyngbya sp. LK]